MFELRDYQQVITDKVRQAYKDGKRSVLVVLPTGGGKTAIFSYIGANASKKGKRITNIAHRHELLKQIAAAFRRFGIEPGLISPSYTPQPSAAVQVASVQTLIKRMARYKTPDLLIIDECHHATAGMWRTICEAYPNALVLGVTATPMRSDGQGLGIKSGGLFDHMIEGPQAIDLVDQGYLVKPRVFRPPTVLDLGNVRTLKTGDYNMLDLAARVDKPSITGDAVKYYRLNADHQPCVVFCVNVLHAKHVAEDFRQHGYRAYALDGDTDADSREKILAGLATGAVEVVTSCDIISEGTDIPAIACAILLRPTQSEGLYVQQVGRALRPMYADGYDLSTVEGRKAAIIAGPKPNGAVILDHVGNTTKHGHPLQVREYTLDGEIVRKEKDVATEEVVKVKQCQNCYAVFEPAIACPECGHKVETRKRGGPEQRDGELVEVEPSRDDLLKAAQTKDIKLQFALKRIEMKSGKPPGWAERKYAELKAKEEAKLKAKAVTLQVLPPSADPVVLTPIGQRNIIPPHLLEYI